jgi:shikimate kinase
LFTFVAEKPNAMKIYLVGYMGSGKSTVGKQLAEMLGIKHIDLDWFFEETYKISVHHFFGKYDENAFRQIENQLLKKTSTLDNSVISTGGGTPCFHGNMDIINQNGISVYIRMHPDSLFKRLKNSKRNRPRISHLSDEGLMQRINDDLKVREKFYQMAQLEVMGEDIDVNKLAEDIKVI